MRPERTALAVALLLAGGAVASYVLGDRADQLTRTLALRRPLAVAIPTELSGWKGRDEALTDAAVEMTGIDDYVRRHYIAEAGSDLMLYVAYTGNKERGMRTYYHNPTVCFPSQGWTLESQRTGVETSPEAALEIPVCRYVFAKDGQRLSVLTFFQVDGEPLDQSPRNKPFWMLLDRATPQFSDSPGTFVQVQVIAPVAPGGEHRASEVQSPFLRAFGHSILKAVGDVRE